MPVMDHPITTTIAKKQRRKSKRHRRLLRKKRRLQLGSSSKKLEQLRLFNCRDTAVTRKARSEKFNQF